MSSQQPSFPGTSAASPTSNLGKPTPHAVKSSNFPPPITPTGPRFPVPIPQQENVASPSLRTPNMQSPSNGVMPSAGSPSSHLSTPPGPPVFSSPVRPAAVPFRSSPSTPQPVAFSSSSPLPTASSPLHFSNGSAELQHQISDSVDEPVDTSKAAHVLFSSHKVTFAFCMVTAFVLQPTYDIYIL